MQNFTAVLREAEPKIGKRPLKEKDLKDLYLILKMMGPEKSEKIFNSINGLNIEDITKQGQEALKAMKDLKETNREK